MKVTARRQLIVPAHGPDEKHPTFYLQSVNNAHKSSAKKYDVGVKSVSKKQAQSNHPKNAPMKRKLNCETESTNFKNANHTFKHYLHNQGATKHVDFIYRHEDK
jgi:hypothetical protein